MKKTGVLFFLFLTALTSYGRDIYWYAAVVASKPAVEIVEAFNKNSEKDKIILITGGSGQLLNKIILSKKCDIYSPASTAYAGKAVESINYIPQKMLKHKVAFGISPKASDKINSFEDLFKKGVKVAIGNPDTMAVGKIFYEKILPKFSGEMKDAIISNKIIDPVNISQTVNYLKANSVDVGVLFNSIARANNLKYIDMPEEYAFTAYYHIGVTKFSEDLDNTLKVIDFIKSQRDIFEKYGFEMAD